MTIEHSSLVTPFETSTATNDVVFCIHRFSILPPWSQVLMVGTQDSGINLELQGSIGDMVIIAASIG